MKCKCDRESKKSWEILCDSVDSFLCELDKCWSHRNEYNKWIFRGVCDSKFCLVPSIFRGEYDAIDYSNVCRLTGDASITRSDFEQMIENTIKSENSGLGKQLTPEQISPLIEIARISLLEIFLVEKFLSCANEVPLHVDTLNIINTPDADELSTEFLYNNLPSLNTKFLKVVCKKSTPSSRANNWIPNNYYSGKEALRSRILCRHHNMLSRLLDWSNHPHKAAFFCTLHHSNNSDVSVWALKKNNLGDSYPANQPVSFHSKVVTAGLEYFSKQEGVLTECNFLDDYYFHHGYWPCLVEYLQGFEMQPSDLMKKITLKGEKVQELVAELDKRGINQYTMMPSYDSVIAFVKKHFLDNNS